MRICIVAEGCYPYVVGGVSSWIHSMIKIFPEYQFVVLAIVANRSLRGKFVYDLPENVVEVHELYLEDADWRPKELKRAARLKLNEREYAAEPVDEPECRLGYPVLLFRGEGNLFE